MSTTAEKLAEALRKIDTLLTNLQPHIPQACYPGRMAFIDNYVSPAFILAREALAAYEAEKAQAVPAGWMDPNWLKDGPVKAWTEDSFNRDNYPFMKGFVPFYLHPPPPDAPSLEQDRKDAERYRWLIENGDHNSGLCIADGSIGTWGECGHNAFHYKEHADEAIDSAMIAQSGEKR